MPKVTKEECPKCPDCEYAPTFLRKSYVVDKETGKKRPNGGTYLSCKCFRLTLGNSGRNLAPPRA